MVNKIPGYTISAGGRFAVLASRSHQGTVSVMVPACCDALESTGVETDDIYIVESPSDSLLPGLARELSKTGFCSTVVVLAVLADGDAIAESILNGMTLTDFERPVVPGLVIGDRDLSTLARVAQDAARQAVEITNLAGILDEMREAANGVYSTVEEEVEEDFAPKRRGRPPKTAAARNVRAGKAPAAAMEAAEVAAPKSKGRPRKAVAAAPTRKSGRKAKSSKTAKRGRGRPKKDTTTA